MRSDFLLWLFLTCRAGGQEFSVPLNLIMNDDGEASSLAGVLCRDGL